VAVLSALVVMVPSCALFRSFESSGSEVAVPTIGPPVSFEIRTVLEQSTGVAGSLAGAPLTTGVIAPTTLTGTGVVRNGCSR
jgi:hypothetical protein